VGTNSTLFQYGQAGVLLAETTGGTATDYIYLNGRPLAMLTGSTFTWLHDDKLGRPQVATNASQTVVWKASYLPYGETLSTSGSFVQNLRFPGQYFDAESGFSQNRFRDYVPSLGRYLEADPIGLYDNANSINSGMNPYLYSGGDPMRFTDKTGLMPPIALPVGFPIGYPTEPIQVVRPWWYPDPIDENGPGYVSSIGFCAGFCDGFSLNDAGGFYSTPGWGCCGPSYSEEYVSNMHAYCEGRSAKLGVLFTFGGNQDSTAWGLQWPPAGFQETWGTPLRTPLPSSKKGGPIYYRP
jgi:RHS repeat-associated protein